MNCELEAGSDTGGGTQTLVFSHGVIHGDFVSASSFPQVVASALMQGEICEW